MTDVGLWDPIGLRDPMSVLCYSCSRGAQRYVNHNHAPPRSNWRKPLAYLIGVASNQNPFVALRGARFCRCPRCSSGDGLFVHAVSGSARLDVKDAHGLEALAHLEYLSASSLELTCCSYTPAIIR